MEFLLAIEGMDSILYEMARQGKHDAISQFLVKMRRLTLEHGINDMQGLLPNIYVYCTILDGVAKQFIAEMKVQGVHPDIRHVQLER